MSSHFANAQIPDWSTGLPQDVISVVRQEAISRGIKPVELVKEWVLDAAGSLAVLPAAPADPSLNVSPTEEGQP